MEKVNVYSLDGKKKELIEKPRIFSFKPRKDVLQESHVASQSRKTQPQGRDLGAGLRTTAESWGTGHGLARNPRSKGSGYPTARNVKRVPEAVGGRCAFPIRVDKRLKKKINKKTNTLSIVSAIAASANPLWIKNRGHLVDKVPEFPLVIDDKIQAIKRTGNIYSILCDLGFQSELIKIKNSKRVRAGKGKKRGRRYKMQKGVLIVIKDNFGIVKATRNISGVDILNIDCLTIDELAPGGLAGRPIIWTQSAFKELNRYEAIV